LFAIFLYKYYHCLFDFPYTHTESNSDNNNIKIVSNKKASNPNKGVKRKKDAKDSAHTAINNNTSKESDNVIKSTSESATNTPNKVSKKVVNSHITCNGNSNEPLPSSSDSIGSVSSDINGGGSDSGGPNGNDKSKKKKARTTFTGRQIFELEKQFEIKKYLSSSERAEMAKLLNVTETQVCIH
jgi:hypothetical protein